MISLDHVTSWLRHWFSPWAKDEETALLERVIYALVLPAMFVIAILIVDSLILWLRSSVNLSVWIGELILLVCLGSIYIVSRHQVRFGARLLVGFALLAAIYLMSLQGYQSVNALFLMIAVVVAVLLLGIRIGSVVAVLSCVLYAFSILAQERGWLVPAAALSPLESVFSLIVGVGLLTGGISVFYHAHQSQRRHIQVLLEQKEALILVNKEKEQLSSALDTEVAAQKRVLARLQVDDQGQSLLASQLHQIFTPVIPVLKYVVVVPMIGELTVKQIEIFTTNVLAGVERHNARLALLDMTGVPQLSEDVAERLVQAVDAIALLGAECVLVGIRPEVAHALINLNVNLTQVVSLRDLQSGIEYALDQTGRRIVSAR